MHVHKKRSSLVMVVLMLVLAGALALSASGRSGTGNNTRLPAAQTAGGFGEVYKANPKTLAKTQARGLAVHRTFFLRRWSHSSRRPHHLQANHQSG